MSININGAIKLDLDGKTIGSIDINQLINDDMFVGQLSQKIVNAINQSYDKQSARFKGVQI